MALPDLEEEGPQIPIENFLDRALRITSWVGLEICTRTKIKNRRICIKKFIKIAKVK